MNCCGVKYIHTCYNCVPFVPSVLSLQPKPGTEKVVLTELICQLEATRAGQAAKDSNIQSLTAELAAMRRALVDAEDERAKMEELYEQVILSLVTCHTAVVPLLQA